MLILYQASIDAVFCSVAPTGQGSGNEIDEFEGEQSIKELAYRGSWIEHFVSRLRGKQYPLSHAEQLRRIRWILDRPIERPLDTTGAPGAFELSATQACAGHQILLLETQFESHGHEATFAFTNELVITQRLKAHLLVEIACEVQDTFWFHEDLQRSFMEHGTSGRGAIPRAFLDRHL